MGELLIGKLLMGELLKGALRFTNTEEFRYIFAKGALFQQKWGLLQDIERACQSATVFMYARPSRLEEDGQLFLKKM